MPEPPPPHPVERILASIPSLGPRDLRSMLIPLNEARQNAEAAHRSAAVQTIATIDLALGDAFAHLDQVDRAFGMWDRCLSSGTPASVMELGGAPLARLVNQRRFAWRADGGTSRAQMLLIGPFAVPFMVVADVVHAVSDDTVERVATAADQTLIRFNPATATMDDILAAAPAEWRPDFVLAANIEMAPLPAGIEGVDLPLVAWAGDLINFYDVIADCLPLFDMVITDQARDREFALARGLPNVRHVLIQSLQSAADYLRDALPYADRPIDIAFLGALDDLPIYDQRRAVVQRIQALADKHNVVVRDNIVSRDAMYDTLRNAKIGLNVSAEFVGRWASHPYRHSCPRRIYEVMSVGAVCLTPSTTEGLAEQYVVGRDLVCFTEDDLEERIAELLDSPTHAAEIARSGREKTLAEHAITDRAAVVVDVARQATKTRRAPAGAAVLRQHYAMSRHARPAVLNAARAVDVDPNERACIAIATNPTSPADPFAEAIRARPHDVIPRLNALLHATETGAWEAAVRVGDELLALVDRPLSPDAMDGWILRQAYLGEEAGCIPWRADMRFEMANAVYADPSRGAGYVEYMRRHLQVAVRDLLACSRYLTGDGDGALSAWEAAHALDPRDEYVALRVAEYWENEGDDVEARRWSLRAGEVRPFNARNAVRIALIHERRGEADAARRIFGSLEYAGLKSRDEALAWAARTAGMLPARPIP